VRAQSLRIGVAADHELLAHDALDLPPLGPAAAAIGRVGALRDHALERRPAHGGKEGTAAAIDVIREAERPGRSEERAEERLSLEQRKTSDVAAEERQAVVDVRAHRDRRRRDGDATVEIHATLQALEARTPARVERDDLAVEREVATGE